ncbi:hypothetical protein O185_16360 [Photorhabdus temperata J3]|uniref:Uncharacterized protein n=1 Tax=Photorhabdus temperata J3 TaxID=1389415 RepID=U7QYB5_PHOTE|nr:hypothetical protein O185_16360 [Photorhabdus temperata J3]
MARVGGELRSIASPEAFVEDFSAAVDFIGTRHLLTEIALVSSASAGMEGLPSALRR